MHSVDEELPPRLLMQYIAEGLYGEWPYDVEIHCLEMLEEEDGDECL